MIRQPVPAGAGAAQAGIAGSAATTKLIPASSDHNLDGLISSINDIRSRIAELLAHIENQPDSLSWTVIMDKFSVISSGMSNLSKMMKTDRAPDTRRIAVVPHVVSQDTDPAVERVTEGRISAVNHDNVPNYLRTKLDPEVEDRFAQALSKAPNMQISESVQKADKQIQNLNKVVNSVLDHVQNAISEWDSKAGSRASAQKFSNEGDTAALLAAMVTGKGLQPAYRGSSGGQSSGPR